MRFSDESILKGVVERDVRAISRLITLCDNRVPRARKILSALPARAHRVHVVGVTGAPGAGKSTLVDQLAVQCRDRGKHVAILAVDPSSPFSGGAILGDRIRMTRASEESGIFIRSLATRGALGGLSRATHDAIAVLDAAGYDVILLETVGVGQGEVDVISTADTCVVVLVPGMGDSVQIIKAGILEIADLFVINKADREGADLVARDLRVLLSLGDHGKDDWLPPILKTVATSGEGASAVLDSAFAHGEWLRTTRTGAERRLRTMRSNVLKLLQDAVIERVLAERKAEVESAVSRCFQGQTSVHNAVEELLGK